MEITQIHKKLNPDIAERFIQATRELSDKQKEVLAGELEDLSTAELNSICDIFSGLTLQQLLAVMHSHSQAGPLLFFSDSAIVRETTLAYKLAFNIIIRGLKIEEILGLTFTSEASGYITDLVAGLLPEKIIIDLPIQTFNAFSIKILKEETFGSLNLEKIGYKKSPTFRVIIGREQILLLKRTIEENNLSEKEFPIDIVIKELGNIKTKLQSPDDYLKNAKTDYQKKIAKISKVFPICFSTSLAVNEGNELHLRSINLGQE